MNITRVAEFILLEDRFLVLGDRDFFLKNDTNGNYCCSSCEKFNMNRLFREFIGKSCMTHETELLIEEWLQIYR